jgi:hypothetical protein
VLIEGVPGFSDDAAYRAMDFLLAALDEVAAGVFASVATLVNLDVDWSSWTTSTYGQVDVPDEPAETLREDPDEVSVGTRLGLRCSGTQGPPQ